MHMQKHITITMNRMMWMPSRKLKSLFSVSFHIKVPLSVFIPLDHSPKFKDLFDLNQRTLSIGGSITVWPVSSLTRLDLTK